MATGIQKKRNKKNQDEDIYPTFNYPGKVPEKEILTGDFGSVRELWADNSNLKFQNRLYFGDNLPILLSLLRDDSICGKVKLIYIDPPFSTNGIFESRSQKKAYTDLLLGIQYVEFLRKRLIILREILANDGSIYVHLDKNMASYIKVIMDEIFGINNFRNWITRKKCNRKNYTRKQYGNISDYILFYTKSKKYVWDRVHEPWPKEKILKEYQYVEKKTGRRFKKVPVHAPGIRKGKTGEPWKGMLPPPGKHWQYTPVKLDEMDRNNEIYWSPTGNPRRKIYFDNSKGIPVQDIWTEFRDAHNQNICITGYPTEKNPDMIEQIIKASSNPGDLVLDCFSGSGTTLAVSSKLNRNWIGVDNSIEAMETTLKRFKVGTEPMGDFINKNNSQKSKEKSLDYFLKDSYNEDRLMVNNFCLFALEPYTGELDKIIKKWLT
jgi:adenine-specific DNA-methyltransferase